MRAGLTLDPKHIADPQQIYGVLGQLLVDWILLLAPFLALWVVVASFAPLALGGWIFALKFKGIHPLKGLARLFSWNSLMELGKALAKFALVAAAAVALLWARQPELLHLGEEPLLPALAHAGWTLGWIFLILSLPMLLVAAVDVPFQILSHLRQLRMTRQEVRDENKDVEGKPEVKGRIRRLQQEFAQRRMMEKIPTADVVITNPSHYAVALRYRQDTMAAPVVVALGVDPVALRIRERAVQHRIPQVTAPLLARALYYHGALDQPIPTSLYAAVAQVLAYVYRLRRDGELDERPIPMNEVPVPPHLRTR
jgi:flagellar biosynthetic protein FlhB